MARLKIFRCWNKLLITKKKVLFHIDSILTIQEWSILLGHKVITSAISEAGFKVKLQ